MTYQPYNRINAFIYIENELYIGETHTECILKILLKKGVVKNEKQFYRMLKRQQQNHKLQSWSNYIQSNSIFGEFSYMNRKEHAIVFDELTDYGIERLAVKLREYHKKVDIIYAKYNHMAQSHYELIPLYYQ